MTAPRPTRGSTQKRGSPKALQKSPSPNFARLLWSAVVGTLQRMGGAHLPVLNAPECAPDRTKFALAGVFVCITTIMAFAGGCFTMLSVFHSMRSAIIAGVIWCTFVATLDISILSTIRLSRGAT